MKTIVLLISFVLINLIAGNLFSSARFDVTEGRLYTLSEGSETIVRELRSPVSIKFFFSETESADIPQLVLYATRIKELLNEFSSASEDNVQLEFFDTRPDSEEESWALRYGLQPFPGIAGKQLFLGLVVDGVREVAITTFDPSREKFLEYDISKAIYEASYNEKVKVALFSSIELKGEDEEEEFISVQRLKNFFDLTELKELEELEDYKLLILVHPKGDDFDQEKVIQFLDTGGKVLLFADAFNAVDLTGGRVSGPEVASSIDQIMEHAGLKFETGLLADPSLATDIRDSQGNAVKFMLYSRLSGEQLSGEFAATSQLENVVLPFPGAITVSEKEGVKVLALASATEAGGLVDYGKLNAGLVNPDSLWRSHQPSDSALFFSVLAELKEGGQLLVVADSDLLNDQNSVQKGNFLGRKIVQPINDNLNLVQNLAEQAAGSSALISLRSRGVSRRPFLVVQRIEAEAKKKYQAEEEKLQKTLQEVNQKLVELQQNKNTLTSDLVAEINKFKQARYEAQQELRKVRRISRSEVEDLENWLFAANTFLIPLLLIVGYFVKVRI